MEESKQAFDEVCVPLFFFIYLLNHTFLHPVFTIILTMVYLRKTATKF